MIVGPDAESRLRLKQATATVVQFGEVTQVGSFDQAVAKFELSGESCDVTFISSAFPPAKIAEFVSKAKGIKGSRDAAFVLILKPKDQDSSKVAESVVYGVDGFLFEPYSVQGLVDITELSKKVKSERQQAREKSAFKLLLKDIGEQIDHVAGLLYCVIDPRKAMHKLREMCEMFKHLKPDSVDNFYDAAADTFQSARPATEAERNALYKGASKAMRRRMEEKMKAKESQVADVSSAPAEDGALPASLVPKKDESAGQARIIKKR